MSTEKTIDISVLPEAEQDLIKALFDKCCERTNQKEEKKSEPKIWKPEYGDWYWYIGSDGQVDNCEWVNGPIDYGRYSMGNCFRTKEEARIAREKQKIKTELQRFADKYNDPEKEAWNNDNGHYMIAFNHRVNDLFITRGYYIEEESATYSFTSDSIARDAIEAVGKDRILKYIFGVESEGENED